MTRGATELTKVLYTGKNDTFHVMIESPSALESWKKDRSIPLPEVVNSFQVFVTHKQGAQGVMNAASNQTLDTEFGTHNEDEVIRKILEEGELQGSTMPERQGIRNVSDGALTGGAMGVHN